MIPGRAAVLLFFFMFFGTACAGEPAAPPDERDPTPDPPAALRPGDTIAGSLTGIDTAVAFRYAPEATGWRTIFVQADAGEMNLTVRRLATGGLLARAFLHPGSGRDLLNNRSDVFPVTTGDDVVVLLQAFAPGSGGPFRLVLHVVDRAPENGSAAFDLGDTVAGRLENSADIDDYLVTALGIESVVLFLDAADSLLPHGVRAQLFGPGDSLLATVFNVRPGSVLDSVASPRIRLPARGAYTVSISESVGPVNPEWGFAGDYRFELYVVNPLPEWAAVTLMAGDTVEAEAIDRRGDVDEFTLTGPAGSEYHLFFQVTAPDTAVRMTLEIAGSPVLDARRNDGSTLLATATPRLVLPDSGRLAVRIFGPDTGRVIHAGPYRVFPYRVRRPPELAAAAVVPDDTVAGETIEAPGDVDEFTLRAGDAAFVQVFVTNDPHSRRLTLSTHDPPTDSVLRARTLDSLGGALGRVTVPAGDSLRLRFEDPPACFFFGCETGYVGAYRFVAVPIDPIPETVPGAYTFGDSVITESIAPVGDLDDFTFDATAGDTLDFWFAVPGGFAGGRLVVLFVEPDRDEVAVLSLGAGQSFASAAVLPETGTYVLRFRGQEDWRGTGGYAFVMRLRP